jgi:hypothetical protein
MLWPGEDESTILLTPEEKSRWHAIYSHPKDAHWWFVNYRWSIDDSPEQIFSLYSYPGMHLRLSSLKKPIWGIHHIGLKPPLAKGKI